MKALPIILGVLAILTAVPAWWPTPEPASAGLGKTNTVFGNEKASPEQVASLRVATWDDETDQSKVFEVAFKDGSWAIPSHHDYPADGQSRVGKTAGAVLGVARGRFITGETKEHVKLGVVDPLAAADAGSDGRGKRVTVKDQSGGTLVDLIIGERVSKDEANPFGGDPKEKTLYFAREADSNEVFAAAVDANISTKFIDWVQPDLLKVQTADIASVVIRDYSVDEGQGVVAVRAETKLSRGETPDTWYSPQAKPEQRVAKANVDKLLTQLTTLKLSGIRPFQPQWLEQRGFYLVPDPTLIKDPNALVLNTARGQAALIGNEGAIVVTTKNGVRYQLFFGEIALGDEEDTAAEAKTAAKPKEGEATPAAPADGHNRYMVVFAQYDAASDQITKAETLRLAEEEARKAAEKKDGEPAATPPTPPKPSVPEGQTTADKAQKRFGRFFYVISDTSFNELRPKAETLFEDKPALAYPSADGKTNEQWLEENGKRAGVTTTASGLQYEVITASPRADANQPKDGDQVQVNYKGTLLDGTEFDASKGSPASFGVNNVIAGWTEALKLMKEGDKWRLFIPAALAYGEKGSPPKIGANQVLVFEVELVKAGP
ncbi:MAG TPA: FKBP-type peptidyl-prolyl cis-trans isomerase [Planctomycetota bacterium]|nr:FKBP-type peptidyl-prolyl cis-trans isomerase [Planctomycetota bacterium]